MKQNEIISKFKLPSYIQGKSFAEASKIINKKFEGRNDMISKTTKEELLTRLANAQEYIKSQSEPNPLIDNTFEGGGFMSPEFLEENPEFGEQSMNISSALTSLIAPGGTFGKQQVKNEDIGFFDKKLNQDQTFEKGLSSVQDTVASAFGPLGQGIRAGQKLGKGIGDAIGGEAGAGVASVFDPTTSAISNLTNKDLNIGEKALGILPGLSGVIASKSAKKRQDKFETDKRKSDYFNNYLNTENNNSVNINKKGGFLDLDLLQPIKNYSTREDDPNYGGEGPEGFFKDNSGVPYATQNDITANSYTPRVVPTVFNQDSKTFFNSENINLPGRQFGKKQEHYNGKMDIKEKSKFDLNNIDGSLLRYTPIAMNAFQLATMGKPEVEKLDRLNNKYQKQFLDEKTYENIVRQQAAAASNAIGRSGVSTGQLINANLATQLNATKGISDAYNQIKQHNIGEEKLRQQTNFNNNQVNVSQSNAEKDINARNRGAFKTERSKLLSELGTSIGQVGKEELFKKYPKMMGMGYNWNGKYFQNQEGDIKTIEEAEALEKDTNTKSKGGFLSSDVTAHINKMYIARKRK